MADVVKSATQDIGRRGMGRTTRREFLNHDEPCFDDGVKAPQMVNATGVDGPVEGLSAGLWETLLKGCR